MPTFIQISLVMFAFAANSLLCRMALAQEIIDPASFTMIRVIAGATILVSLSLLGRQSVSSIFKLNGASVLIGGSLFCYAACFSFAYTMLSTGTGALLLFGTVQLSLISWSFYQGQRFSFIEWAGISLSSVGFAILVLPSAEQPSLLSALLMVLSGLSWAVFTLVGKKQSSGLLSVTQGFVGASILSLLLIPWLIPNHSLTLDGVWLAVLSGAITSGLGYYLWYKVLPKISTLKASISQLSVPAIAMLLGSFVLSEPLTLHTLSLSAMILLGIAMTFLGKRKT